MAQRGVRIGYIDMDVILENVDEYKTANQLLEKKVESWKKINIMCSYFNVKHVSKKNF